MKPAFGWMGLGGSTALEWVPSFLQRQLFKVQTEGRFRGRMGILSRPAELCSRRTLSQAVSRSSANSPGGIFSARSRWYEGRASILRADLEVNGEACETKRFSLSRRICGPGRSPPLIGSASDNRLPDGVEGHLLWVQLIKHWDGLWWWFRDPSRKVGRRRDNAIHGRRGGRVAKGRPGPKFHSNKFGCTSSSNPRLP